MKQTDVAISINEHEHLTVEQGDCLSQIYQLLLGIAVFAEPAVEDE